MSTHAQSACGYIGADPGIAGGGNGRGGIVGLVHLCRRQVEDAVDDASTARPPQRELAVVGSACNRSVDIQFSICSVGRQGNDAITAQDDWAVPGVGAGSGVEI